MSTNWTVRLRQKLFGASSQLQRAAETPDAAICPPGNKFWRSPSNNAAPFAVSWQLYRLDRVREILAADIAPDFQWWALDPDYEPLGLNYTFYHGEALTLGELYPDPEKPSFCLALQIDILRPQFDYLELRYPAQAIYFLLDTDTIALANIKQHGVARRWLALATTTANDSPISALRRTIFFPEITHLNAAKGTSFKDVAPTPQFAAALETCLNAIGPTQLEANHWDQAIDGSAGPHAQVPASIRF